MSDIEKSALKNNYNLDFSNKYNDYSKMVEMVKQDKESEVDKYEEIKERVQIFKNIKSFEEAKQYAPKKFPTATEKTKFFVGKAQCIVINKSNQFRIILDSDKEYLCYEFVKNN